MKFKRLYLKFWLKAFGKDNGELPPPSASTAWNPIFYALAVGVSEIIVDPMEFAMLVNGKPTDVELWLLSVVPQIRTKLIAITGNARDVVPDREERFVKVGRVFGIDIIVDRQGHKLPKE